jgi:hypothetical protein
LIKRIFALLLLFFPSAVCVFSVPLEELVSTDYAARLRGTEQGRIVEVKLKNPAPVLTPNHSGIRQSVTGIINAFNPNTMVETLFLYSKSAHLKTDSGSWDDVQKITVFNQVTAISTLTGIQYYSSSRGAMRTFYEYSNIIDGPVTKKPLSDPVFTQPPAVLTLFARQKDLTFGDNIYRYDYVNDKDAVFFTQENITTLNYGIIPVIGKGNLRAVMAVIDCGDAILVYAVFTAKIVSVPGLSDRIVNSFTNRAEAVLHWFCERLNKNL